MKLITLNTWGGRVYKELVNFLIRHQDVDIFCFQEIYHKATHIHVAQGGIDPNLTLFDDIEKALPDHQGYFRPHYLETYGLATFVKKELAMTREDELFVHHYREFIPEGEVANHARNVQMISLNTAKGTMHIFNFHGLHNGKGKTDSKDRLEQSKKLTAYVKGFDRKKVLCGDFNLLPDTESIKMVEALPMRNLITEYNITSTRSSFYDKSPRFADYMFVNDAVDVKNFKVLPEEVSDHLPLYLEFE